MEKRLLNQKGSWRKKVPDEKKFPPNGGPADLYPQKLQGIQSRGGESLEMTHKATYYVYMLEGIAKILPSENPTSHKCAERSVATSDKWGIDFSQVRYFTILGFSDGRIAITALFHWCGWK
jgi:hypothetical protein